MLSKQKQAEYRQNLIGVQFLPCPSEQQIRVFITGQILSAQNFPDSQIFISYKISLPEGWKGQKLQQYSNTHLTQQQSKQLNCLQSITHSVFPVVQKNQEGGVVNKFYFCFPIDIQLIAHQKAAQKSWPVIHFEVFSKDYWDRIYMHGCGFVQFPSQQGSHLIKTQTWKPSLDARSKVSEFFLGGIVRPKNIQNISKSQMSNELDQKGPINRIMFKTESSGTIKTRLNIATQKKQVKTDQRVNFKTYKFSEQTEKRKGELSQMDSIPSSFNTGIIGGNRNTNTRLY